MWTHLLCRQVYSYSIQTKEPRNIEVSYDQAGNETTEIVVGNYDIYIILRISKFPFS